MITCTTEHEGKTFELSVDETMTDSEDCVPAAVRIDGQEAGKGEYYYLDEDFSLNVHLPYEVESAFIEHLSERWNDSRVSVRFLVPTKKRAADTDVNRIGGLPVGLSADRWPKAGKGHARHALTVDLRGTAMVGDRAAVAVFEAPHNLTLVFLSEADLSSGVHPPPPGLKVDAKARKLELRSDDVDRQQLRERSYLDGPPVWLQGEVAANDEVVLQLASDLVNVPADCGVAYILADGGLERQGY